MSNEISIFNTTIYSTATDLMTTTWQISLIGIPILLIAFAIFYGCVAFTKDKDNIEKKVVEEKLELKSKRQDRERKRGD